LDLNGTPAAEAGTPSVGVPDELQTSLAPTTSAALDGDFGDALAAEAGAPPVKVPDELQTSLALTASAALDGGLGDALAAEVAPSTVGVPGEPQTGLALIAPAALGEGFGDPVVAPLSALPVAGAPLEPQHTRHRLLWLQTPPQATWPVSGASRPDLGISALLRSELRRETVGGAHFRQLHQLRPSCRALQAVSLGHPYNLARNGYLYEVPAANSVDFRHADYMRLTRRWAREDPRFGWKR
jgi:hypothetical protein